MEKYIEEIKENLNEDKKNATILSYIRLINFLLFLTFFILTLVKYYDLFYILMFVFFFGFVLFIVIHNKVHRRIERNEYKIKVYDDNESRKNLKFSHFKDKGLDFNKDENNYLSDLNIIGEYSLFEYMVVAKTKLGRSKLFDYLNNKEIDETWKTRQEAIEELSKDDKFFIDFASDLYQYGDILNKKNVSNALKNLEDDKLENSFKKPYLFVLFGFYLVSIISFVFSFFFGFKIFLSVLILELVFSSIYFLINQNENKNTINCFNDFDDIIKNINGNFNSEMLNKKIETIKTENYKLLNKTKLLYDLRGNIFTYVFLNALFGINILADYSYDKFLKSTKMPLVIESIAEMEAILSLSIINRNFDSVLPELNSKFEFRAKNLYHPFIKNGIKNSFNANSEPVLITGSNMSGKTSFLRTLGINMILFKAGTRVCADKFISPDMKIFTAINIKDEISKGISTFYKEILTVKKAIDYDKNRMVLIDEIFKGTNANDRITGAKSLINKLNKENVLLVITTHDFELCDLDFVTNYHFSEYYVDDKIHFDFKIKDGKCKTTNAIYLLKKANII